MIINLNRRTLLKSTFSIAGGTWLGSNLLPFDFSDLNVESPHKPQLRINVSRHLLPIINHFDGMNLMSRSLPDFDLSFVPVDVQQSLLTTNSLDQISILSSHDLTQFDKVFQLVTGLPCGYSFEDLKFKIEDFHSGLNRLSDNVGKLYLIGALNQSYGRLYKKSTHQWIDIGARGARSLWLSSPRVKTNEMGLETYLSVSKSGYSEAYPHFYLKEKIQALKFTKDFSYILDDKSRSSELFFFMIPQKIKNSDFDSKHAKILAEKFRNEFQKRISLHEQEILEWTTKNFEFSQIRLDSISPKFFKVYDSWLEYKSKKHPMAKDLIYAHLKHKLRDYSG